eukprot:gene9201-12411_t
MILNAIHASGVYTIVSFYYTGYEQSWSIPFGVNSIDVDLCGASGGSFLFDSGGAGGRLQTTLSVSFGDIIYVYVGQVGQCSSSSNFNGGGKGISTSLGCGGGGASDVRSPGNSLSDRLAVAGGGGGCRAFCGVSGGAGGGAVGADAGSQDNIICLSYTAAKGGSQGSGGNGGKYAGADLPDGSLGYGGDGDTSNNSGGGGGYYGGGAGGGGGSSYSCGTLTTHTRGACATPYVNIYYTTAPSYAPTPEPSAIP